MRNRLSVSVTLFVALAFAAVLGAFSKPTIHEAQLGRVALWRSCAADALQSPENPGGLSSRLLNDGMHTVAVDDWIPALDRAAEAIGYKPDFVLWMPAGVWKNGKILAYDAYPALCESGTGYPEEYGPTLRLLNSHIGQGWWYTGSPESFVKDKDDPRRWAWSVAPMIESGWGVVLDAQADRYTEEGDRAAEMIRDWCGLPLGVEPRPAIKSRWVAEKTPGFVMLQTERGMRAANYSLAYNSERNPPGGLYILVGDYRSITVDEAVKYTLEGCVVVMPIDTPPAMLRDIAVRTRRTNSTVADN